MFDDNNLNISGDVLVKVQDYACDHWPEMQGAEMKVQRHTPNTPSPELLNKLNGSADAYRDRLAVRETPAVYAAAPAPATSNGSDQYTVTLRKHIRTESGATLHRIARILIDGRGNVLKATTSKLRLIAIDSSSRGANIAPLLYADHRGTPYAFPTFDRDVFLYAPTSTSYLARGRVVT